MLVLASTSGMVTVRLACSPHSLVRVTRRARCLPLRPGRGHARHIRTAARRHIGELSFPSKHPQRHQTAPAPRQAPLLLNWHAPKSSHGTNRAGRTPTRDCDTHRDRLTAGYVSYTAPSERLAARTSPLRAMQPTDAPQQADNPTPLRVQLRVRRIWFDVLFASLPGCFAQFPHGTFVLSGSCFEI